MSLATSGQLKRRQEAKIVIYIQINGRDKVITETERMDIR